MFYWLECLLIIFLALVGLEMKQFSMSKNNDLLVCFLRTEKYVHAFHQRLLGHGLYTVTWGHTWGC